MFLRHLQKNQNCIFGYASRHKIELIVHQCPVLETVGRKIMFLQVDIPVCLLFFLLKMVGE